MVCYRTSYYLTRTNPIQKINIQIRLFSFLLAFFNRVEYILFDKMIICMLCILLVKFILYFCSFCSFFLSSTDRREYLCALPLSQAECVKPWFLGNWFLWLVLAKVCNRWIYFSNHSVPQVKSVILFGNIFNKVFNWRKSFNDCSLTQVKCVKFGNAIFIFCLFFCLFFMIFR